ncbi:polyprenyl synthetase family protein [Paenibacillus sp. MBLB4367]|uniref:polyprenyl synthetase family protein n=1 Tax=Paenibacillus sp. MBLB4367 TaxID=3384767 RepID=UPI003908017B
MKPEVVGIMNLLVDDYVQAEAFRELLKSFIADKAEEQSIWSDITLLAHYMLGGDGQDIDRRSALTEIIVLALDIADDLQDEDNEAKPWMRCPRELALNALLAFNAMASAELGRLQASGTEAGRVVSEVSRMVMRAVNGQYKDLSGAVLTEEDYEAAVREKSGSLVRLACYLGYAGLPVQESAETQLNDLADCIGMVAQIENDVKDVQRYDLKNDLLQRKRTLPVLFLLEEPAEEFPFIHRYYAGEMTKEQFLLHKQDCLAYIRDSGCLEYSRVIQSLYADKAEQLLGAISAVSPWKERFAGLTLGFAK